MRGQAVKDAPAGKTIKITGTIQAASASGNYGELEITKNLTIEAKSGTATLDANSSVLGSNAHRIFNVTGGNFKLYNMVLQSGNAGENEGGGIYVSGGELVLSETTIKMVGRQKNNHGNTDSGWNIYSFCRSHKNYFYRN